MFIKPCWNTIYQSCHTSTVSNRMLTALPKHYGSLLNISKTSGKTLTNLGEVFAITCQSKITWTIKPSKLVWIQSGTWVNTWTPKQKQSCF